MSTLIYFGLCYCSALGGNRAGDTAKELEARNHPPEFRALQIVTTIVTDAVQKSDQFPIGSCGRVNGSFPAASS